MTARKSTTPAKRPPARKPVDAFDELRKRARAVGIESRSDEANPFVVPGFDPPVEVHWPTSLVVRDDLDVAMRAGDTTAVLRGLLGDDYRRVLVKLDEYADKDVLISGLVISMIEHFVGPGAFDVPGGTEAS